MIRITDPCLPQRQNRFRAFAQKGEAYARCDPVQRETLRTLPTDAAPQAQWGLADRFDLQMLLQATRSVARGPFARLVANGGRNSYEWTDGKAALLEAFDEAGITAVFMNPEQGGLFAGPKNLALAWWLLNSPVRRRPVLRVAWRWLPSTSAARQSRTIT